MLVKEVRAIIEGADDDDVFQLEVTEHPKRFNISLSVIKPAIESEAAPVVAPEAENAAEATTEAVA